MSGPKIVAVLAWTIGLLGPLACLVAWIWTANSRWALTGGVCLVAGFGLGIAWAALTDKARKAGRREVTK